MDLKKDYNTLYQHWLKEFNHVDLTSLTEEEFQNYKNIVKTVSNFELKEKIELQIQLLESYKENFNFLFNDFLKIRELKIINSALALQDINLDHVIEAEKLFYQNLVSSIKGFKKLKALLIYEEEDLTKVESVLQKDETITKVQKTDRNIEEIQNIIQEGSIEDSELILKRKVSNYNYTVIRFLKKTPPLVGIDLINYGPFKENDVANMPYKNAKILIFEKFAEKVDVS